MHVKNYYQPQKHVFKGEDTPEHHAVHLEIMLAYALFNPSKVEKLQLKATQENISLIEILASLVKETIFYEQLAFVVGAQYSPTPPQKTLGKPFANEQNWREAISSGLLRCDENSFWHAPQDKQLVIFIANCEKDPAFATRFILCPPKAFKKHLRATSRTQWINQAVNAVAISHPHLSAKNEKQMRRGAIYILCLVAFASFFMLQGGMIALSMGLFLSFIFLGWLLFRVAASLMPIYAPFPKGRPQKLPLYTLVLALYKEVTVLPSLIKALERLDYPYAKLDIKLVLESDDTETLFALSQIESPLHFDVILAPQEGPRTKPKALMLALPYARGEFCVVYDAEDRPHPMQLLESVARFSESKATLGVLQAPLVIRNHARNALTKLFAAEYAALFDLTLPLLAKLDMPLPLGGTSNHFRTKILRDVGGWDAFNVTEDADLGLRLARFGFSAGVLSLGTSEEAPVQAFAWLKQRSRWFKGWLQTLIVHSGTPKDLLKRLGIAKSLVFFLMIGSTFFSSLLHPLAYVLLAAYGLGWVEGNSLTLITLILTGYGLAMFLLWQGARLGQRAPPRFALLLLPFYWLMLSAAAWLALFELYRRPFHWAKTTHHGD